MDAHVLLLFGNKFALLIQYFGVNGTKMYNWAVEPVYTMDYSAGLQEPSAIGLLIGHAVAAIVITALALFLFPASERVSGGHGTGIQPDQAARQDYYLRGYGYGVR